jgi:hypothetical protein
VWLLGNGMDLHFVFFYIEEKGLTGCPLRFRQKQSHLDRFIRHRALFWTATILSSIASLAFFLVPFFMRGPQLNETVPPLSYLSILFFFLCFWLLNKRTEIRK